MATVITNPPAEAALTGVPHDDRTAGGLLLPHHDNSARIDIERLRASLIMLDALVSGVPDQVSDAFAALVGSAPATLDTIGEIATALGNNPNAITEIMTALGLRATTAQLTTAVANLQGQIDGLTSGKASAASLAAITDRVGALETIAPSRARLIARAVAYSGVR